MDLNNLTAISPIDGRYRKQIEFLDEYFSEYALIKYRVLVEVQYFFFLADYSFFELNNNCRQQLQTVSDDFSVVHAQRIKEIEVITNHDVKAVEYFLKEQLEEAGGSEVKEWIHFGLTSQDINNTSIPLSWKACMEQEYLPSLVNLQKSLQSLAQQWKGFQCLQKHTDNLRLQQP
jgi:adenylosuccinate lyase